MDKKCKKRKETYSKHKKQKNRLKKQKYFSFVRRICVLVRGSGGAGGTDRDRSGGNEYYPVFRNGTPILAVGRDDVKQLGDFWLLFGVQEH